jgi:hypothetical protein
MSAPDAMDGEMPGFIPGRPGGEHDEPLLDMIFERRPIPPGAPPEMHDLARMLAAAAGPAEPGELTGEAAALAAFSRLASRPGISPAAPRSARRWLSGRPPRGRLPLAAALVVAAAGLGSTAAAYAGVLPGPIQHLAHAAIGVPDSPRPTPSPKHPAGPRRHSAPRKTTPPVSRKPRSATFGPARGNSGSRARHHNRPWFSPGHVCVPGDIPPLFATYGQPSPTPTQNPLGSGPTATPTSPQSPKPSPTQNPLGSRPTATPQSPTTGSCPSLPGEGAYPGAATSH